MYSHWHIWHPFYQITLCSVMKPHCQTSYLPYLEVAGREHTPLLDPIHEVNTDRGNQRMRVLCLQCQAGLLAVHLAGGVFEVGTSGSTIADQVVALLVLVGLLHDRLVHTVVLP